MTGGDVERSPLKLLVVSLFRFGRGEERRDLLDECLHGVKVLSCACDPDLLIPVIYFHGDGLFKDVVCFDFRDAKRFLSIAKNPTRNQNSRWIHCRENVDFSEAPSTSSLPNDTHVSGAFVRSDGQANLDVLQRRLHGSAQHLQHRSLANGRGVWQGH